MGIAYSYVRFSSEKQSLGDSVRRQLKLAEDYAAKNNLVLDTHTYRDLGVSAYRGKNAIEGKLGTFLQALEDGVIKPGCFLLVESLDRLSRNEVDEALELFLRIIRYGVRVVTLADGQEYSKERIKQDRGISLIISISVMMRAHEESSIKSDRVKAAWKRKLASGEPITRGGPSWLKLVDGQWQVDEQKAEVIKRIFRLALDGHGSPTIARMLNQDGVPTMQRAECWTYGVVHALIRNPAVIGRFEPSKAIRDPIDNYYPQIIEPALFNEVRARVKSRRWKPGAPKSGMINLFSGLLKCARCGTSMRMTGNKNGHSYMVCISSYARNGCDAKRVPYKAIELAILSKFHAQNRDLIAITKVIAEDETPRIQAEIVAVQQRISNLIKLAEVTGDIDEIGSKLAELKVKQKSLEAELANAVPVEPPQGRLLTQLKNNYDVIVGGDEQARLQAQSTIRRFVKQIDIESVGPEATVTFLSGTVRTYDVRPFRERVEHRT